MCYENKDVKFEEVVKYHFDSLIETQRFSKEFEKREEDFEYIKEYLATRIYSYDYLNKLEFNVIYEKITDELYQVLVYDFSNTV